MVVVDRDTSEGNAFAESHRIYYQPGFVVIGIDGKVLYSGLGPYDPNDVRSLVRAAATGAPLPPSPAR